MDYLALVRLPFNHILCTYLNNVSIHFFQHTTSSIATVIAMTTMGDMPATIPAAISGLFLSA